MRKRGLCYHPVSVRPSVTLVDCIQTADDIVKHFVRPDKPHHSSFFDLSVPMPNSEGNSFSGVQNTRGWEKVAIFD